ncbi:elongator complex protein 2 [Trichomonascus vanleenenianus]|uniref:Elongator subunit ELP2 n=1 Tax=Trichomonascus vanleenenianus TaxID=2268995 RepID=UPI003EC9E730
MEISTEFVSVGANRHPGASDYSPEHAAIAFGAGVNVAFYRSGSVELSRAADHAKAVTEVRFGARGRFMVTGGSEGRVVFWDLAGGVNKARVVTTVGLDRAVTALACHGDAADELVVAVATAAGSMFFYKYEDDKFELAQEVRPDAATFYAMCLAVHRLGNGQYLVAAGGTQNKIFVLVGSIGAVALEARLEGHENWVRGLAFKETNDGDVLLASASQDRYIRLWRVHRGDVSTIGGRTSKDTENEGVMLANKPYYVCRGEYSVTFEALIMGHDDWVFAVHWHPERLELLSSSADSSAMVWNPDESSGVWVCTTRLGDVSIKGASTATGASGGFWNALWAPIGGVDHVAAIGKTGSWRLWRKTDDESWVSELGVTGPAKEVTDVAWGGSNGEYLLATSLDQTTRLYAPWTKGDGKWHEMARPQIHGYDMISVKPVTASRFVSAGDEKTLRVFDEPRGIAQLLETVCGIAATTDKLPESGIVPALGLSNKQEENTTVVGVADEEDDENENDEAPSQSAYELLSQLNHPPLEDHLQRHTLWPEVDKLYGHGYEVTNLDISHDGRFLATSCKANTEKHAVIRLYDTTTWLQLPNPLQFHSLTITRLEFSPDDQLLLSVSRDRTWALWKKNNEGDNYEMAVSNSKAHTRIIWDCVWLPEGNAFITAGRDKAIKVWRQDSTTNEWAEHATMKHSEPVTSLAFNPITRVLAAGTDSGAIALFWVSSSLTVEPLGPIPPPQQPVARINRLAWRPNSPGSLAAASDDKTIRIYSIATANHQSL